jgi:hypothetical protein
MHGFMSKTHKKLAPTPKYLSPDLFARILLKKEQGQTVQSKSVFFSWIRLLFLRLLYVSVFSFPEFIQ